MERELTILYRGDGKRWSERTATYFSHELRTSATIDKQEPSRLTLSGRFGPGRIMCYKGSLRISLRVEYVFAVEH